MAILGCVAVLLDPPASLLSDPVKQVVHTGTRWVMRSQQAPSRSVAVPFQMLTQTTEVSPLEASGNSMQPEEVARPIAVAIALERPYHFPGQAVQGYVEMTVIEPEPCLGVYVRVSGEAFTSVVTTAEDGNKSTVQELTSLFDQTFLIATAPGDELAPGRHQFTFSAKLPSDLPPSCSRSTDRGSVHIAYQVSASIDRPDGEHVLLRKVFLNIEQTTPKASNKNVVISDQADEVLSLNGQATAAAVLSGGATILGGLNPIDGDGQVVLEEFRLSKDVLDATLGVTLQGRVRNRSDKDVEFIRISVEELIMVHAGEKNSLLVTSGKSYSDDGYVVTLPGVRAGKSRNISETVRPRGLLVPSLDLPGMIEARHELVLQCIIGKSFVQSLFTTQPTLRVPITLARGGYRPDADWGGSLQRDRPKVPAMPSKPAKRKTGLFGFWRAKSKESPPIPHANETQPPAPYELGLA